MAVTALRGAVGFLTRLPVRTGDADWDAFRHAPWTFPLVGYLVGVLAALTLLLPLPAPAAVAAYLLVLYLVTGVNHADGLADLGDALAVHGDERRRAVLKDSALGVGGTLSIGVVLVGVALTVASVADASVYAAARLVVAAEVGAKLGMALLACIGESAHRGIGSEFTDNIPRAIVVPAMLSLPVLLVGSLGVAVLGGPVVALVVRRVTRGWLGGINGDVFGATNELGRLAGLLLGVLAWTVW